MPMLGPFDQRTVRKRCVECTRRKIKCEGGPPCQYCVKKKRACVPQRISSAAGVVFVGVSAQSPRSNTLSDIASLPAPRLCPQLIEGSAPFIHHFFSDFLVRNNFGRVLDLDTVISEFQKSSSLHHASVAVGALDLSKRPLSYLKYKDAAVNALVAYNTSIVQFQRDIKGKNALLNSDTLWTTLFLGLFELMYDKTGEGWMKHIFYGTSKILQLRGPKACLTGPGRSFYLTARVFEVCRSLIYSEPTFLSQPKWRSLMIEMRKQDLNGTLHPKEHLFDLMIRCSSLSQYVLRLIELGSKNINIPLQKALVKLAVEGLAIRLALDNWYINFKKLSAESETLEQSMESTLAIIYFHGISIYLSGIFDYHSQFNDLVTPAIQPPVIQNHVDMILANTAIAMKTTNLSPALFFFPLRVAGARVTSIRETEAILELLQQISEGSFPVADAFIEDLMSLWQWKKIS